MIAWGNIQVAFGGEQLRDETERRDKEHVELMPADPFPGEGGDEVRLASAGEAEAEEIIAAAHEVGFEQGRDLSPDFFRQEFNVEGFEGFAEGQAGVFELARDLALEPVSGLGFEEIGEEALVAPVFGFGSVDGLVVLAGDHGQVHRA